MTPKFLATFDGARDRDSVSVFSLEDRAGLVDIGHRPSRQELSVEQRDSVASLTSMEENVLEVGRTETTKEEKWVGGRL